MTEKQKAPTTIGDKITQEVDKLILDKYETLDSQDKKDFLVFLKNNKTNVTNQVRYKDLISHFINAIIEKIQTQVENKYQDIKDAITANRLSVRYLLQERELSEIAKVILNAYLEPDNKEKADKIIIKKIAQELRRYTPATIQRDIIHDFRQLISILYPDVNIVSHQRFKQRVTSLEGDYIKDIEIQNVKGDSKKDIKEIKCYFACSSSDRQFLEDLTEELKDYNIKISNNLLLSTWQQRKDAIINSDLFCIIISVSTIFDTICMDISLALELYEASNLDTLKNKPEIIFIGNNLSNLSNKTISCEDKKYKVSHYKHINFEPSKKEKKTAELIQEILPPITFIQNLDDEEENLWFIASQKPYEELFFPIYDERLPFEEIRYRISNYNMENPQKWYELYAIWHKDVNNINRLKDEQTRLSNRIIGMAYFCIHLPTGWTFANYLVVDQVYRNPKRLDFFLDSMQEKLTSKINNEQGVIFEVEHVDFNFLVEVNESKIKIKGSEIEDKFITQYRRLRRLNLFVDMPNTYIVLDREGNPFPYVQPGMDEPVIENNTPRLLMVHLLSEELIDKNKQDGDMLPLVQEMLNFLYDYLFLSGSDERALGYVENVEQVKLSVNKSLQQLERPILGDLKKIRLANTKYDCIKLYQSLYIKKVNPEQLNKDVRLL